MCDIGQIVLALPDGIDPDKEARSVNVDACIALPIQHLLNASVQTRGCCCGHGEAKPSIILSQECKDVDILEALLLLSKVDERDWDVFQWQLVNVSGTLKQ